MDHGCQYLANEAFIELDRFQECLGRWDPIRSESYLVEADHYPDEGIWQVGVPTMSAIPKAMAQALEVKLNARVTELKQVDDAWVLLEDSNTPIAVATWVLSAIPSPQALPLLEPHEFSELKRMSMASYDPNWTLMLIEPAVVLNEPTVFKPKSESIAWIVNQKSKPGRPDVNAWVVQAHTQWSIDNLELSQEEVIRELLPEISKAIGRQIDGQASAHRWRYAFVNRPVGEPSLIDSMRRLGACGDWCLGDTAAHAMRSGQAAAEGILKTMK